MEFWGKITLVVIFKIFAVLAFVVLFTVEQNNFSMCADAKGIQCIGNATVAEGVQLISEEIGCTDVKDRNCCRYIYEDNPQCYMTVAHQSIFAGYAGVGLMLFAEVFYLVALLVYMVFPFLTKFMMYRGEFVRGPKTAALASSEIFSKAIYFITPILLILIIWSLYRNLPFFM